MAGSLLPELLREQTVGFWSHPEDRLERTR